jgi:hypothetical protein
MLTEKENEVLAKCWETTKGKAWEPKGGTNHPFIHKFVAEGFVRIVDGRCGFEAFKDVMVEWTEAGKRAFSK